MCLTVGSTVETKLIVPRALKTVMVPRALFERLFMSDQHPLFFQLYNQRRPAIRSRQDREGPGRAPDMNGNGNSGSGGAGDQAPTARPRGMSDAQMRPSDPRQMSGGGMVRGGNVTTTAKDGRLHTSESIYG